jgi:hypothetical protein
VVDNVEQPNVVDDVLTDIEIDGEVKEFVVDRLMLEDDPDLNSSPNDRKLEDDPELNSSPNDRKLEDDPELISSLNDSKLEDDPELILSPNDRKLVGMENDDDVFLVDDMNDLYIVYRDIDSQLFVVMETDVLNDHEVWYRIDHKVMEDKFFVLDKNHQMMFEDHQVVRDK